jgi:hypothetical protein
VSLPTGLFQHYKGTVYRVITVARREADPTVLEVIYTPVDGPEDAIPWERPLASWREAVTWPDGVERPRFTRWAKVPSPS